jgi:hypothetical protein
MKISWLVGAGAGLILLAAGGAYAMRVADQAGVGAAVVAKITCSCVFVAARTPESCRADDPPGFEQVTTEIDTTAKAVTARVLGVITRRATYHEAYGCTLEP